MNDYVITFFTHYDALVCQRALAAAGITGQLAPVPRRLSSSCGTCLLFSAPKFDLALLEPMELERLVRRCGREEYETLLERE